MTSSSIIDISPILSPNIAVWPGDTPLSRKILCNIMDAGNNIDLSTLTSTVHVGSHADAPRHYHPQGKTIDQIDLNRYIGPCHVLTVQGVKLILPSHLGNLLSLKPQRVLFRTLSQPDPNAFNTDFTAISPDTLSALGDAGVVLVGIDTPSVDPFESKALPAHAVLYKYGMANVEGLRLSDVKDGLYEFIGLPLKLEGFDASPIRAVLRSI